MKILGLIASPNDPASRYRILQYFPYLKNFGIDAESRYFLPTKDSSPAEWTKKMEQLTSIDPWRTWNVLQNISRLPLLATQFNYDLFWQSRMLLPYLFNGEKLINKPVVFDIDDAIWLSESKEKVSKAISAAGEVFAGNEYLAEWCKKYNNNVSLVPTTVDIKNFVPQNKETKNFTIGWIGTQSNFKYLHLIEPAIKNFLSKYVDARFTIVSSIEPGFIKFDNNKIIFKQWNAESENVLINEFSIGIMPLSDDEWTRGKCGFKLLQYMACGKPVVASPVGVNKKLIDAETGLSAQTEDDWFNAFEKLYHDKVLCKSFGENGRGLVEKEYSTQAWAATIAKKFTSLKN